ncbi:MAG: tetratricopeptide repeat protein [Planctomycetota bacterium]
MAINLGIVFLELERAEEAQDLLERAFQDAREILSEDDNLTLFAKENLSRLHAFNGNLNRAAQMQNEVFDSRVNKLGLHHPLTLSSNVRITRLLAQEGQLDAAKKIAEETLVIAREHLGKNHRTTLSAMIQLADVLSKLEEFDVAISTLNEAEQLWLSNYPDEKQTQRSIRNDLGNAYLEKGHKNSDAESLRLAHSCYQQNLAELEPVLPADHGHILAAETGCAYALFWLKEYREAEAIARNSLFKLKKKYPQGHNEILKATNTLAVCYTKLDRVDDAIEMFKSVIEGQQAILSKGNPNTIASMINFGMQLNTKKRYEEAVDVLDEAEKLATEYTPDHKRLVNSTRAALAIVYRGIGNTDLAIEILEQVIQETGYNASLEGTAEILRKCYFEKRLVEKYLETAALNMSFTKRAAGSNVLGYSGYILKIGQEMLDLELYDQAIEVYRESLEIRTSSDPEAWYTHNAKSKLGDALLAAGRFEEAEPVLLEGYEGLVETHKEIPLNMGPKRLRAAAERLVKFAKATKDEKATKRWLKELNSISVEGN